MERKGGIATIVLVLAALFGVSYLPRRASPSSAETGQERAAETSGAGTEAAGETSTAAPKIIPACVQIAARLRRFTTDRPAMPGSCYADFEEGTRRIRDVPGARLSDETRFAIALVPNPIATHLPLLFDRAVEAIQQAAEDENYAYDSSWFPWNSPTKGKESSSDDESRENKESLQERQPGVLVYRGGLDSEKPARTPYQSALIIFLVAEQPTGGLSDWQFENALQWMRALQRDSDQQALRIIGPTFSGTLPSLARMLDAATLAHYPGLTIHSGSVSSETGVHWFNAVLEQREEELKGKGGAEKGPSLRFRTFSEGDTVMTDRFLCFLRDKGYGLDQVAILSEDETAFGKTNPPATPKPGEVGKKTSSTGVAGPIPWPPACGTGDESPVHLYYPRDIATLRSAYQRQSVFSATRKSSDSTPGTTLRTDLTEPASSEHDTVRTYSGQLLPLAQEAVLFGITNMLESKHIEFVIIRSSNSLDQLFLSEFLRRSYPGARLVLDGADLLFRKGMEGASLRGVMLLSTYPLLTWTQDAAPVIRGERSNSYRIFPQDMAEGIYIAARELFETTPTTGSDPATSTAAGGVPPSTVPIFDYRPPRSATLTGNPDSAAVADIQRDDSLRPATWVSVVGHRQFWAVAILNSNTMGGSDKEARSGLKAHDRSLLKPEPSDDADETPAAQSGVPAGQSARSDRAAVATQSPPDTKGWVARLEDRWNRGRGIRSPGELTALLVFCLALSGWHFFCASQGSIVGAPLARAYFAPIPRVQHSVLIFVGSLVIGVLGITLAFSTGVFSRMVLVPRWHDSIALFVLLIVLCGFMACLMSSRLPIVASGGDDTRSIVERIDLQWRSLAPAAWLITLAVLGLLRYYYVTDHLTDANRMPAYVRSVHLRSGVSPLLPQVLLILGMYAWFWFTLRGVSVFGDDRPLLPSVDVLPMLDDPDAPRPSEGAAPRVQMFRMFSREHAGRGIEAAALPLEARYVQILILCLLSVIGVFWVSLGEAYLRTLGDRRFGALVFGCVCLVVAVIVADSVQLLRIWSKLRQLLIYLDRLRLRRTLQGLKGLSWESVWTMSANVLEERYRLISRQLESATSLHNLIEAWEPRSAQESAAKECALAGFRVLREERLRFAAWYVRLTPGAHDVSRLATVQRLMADTAGTVMSEIILPAWQKETGSLLIGGAGERDRAEAPAKADAAQGPDLVRAAEEFFVLPYVGFIQNILGRCRSLAMGVLALFVATTLALSSYPFDPLPIIGAIFLIVFLLVGASTVFVYAQMHRDATISRITNTTPGELGLDFWLRTATFGIGPLIGLLTTLFPSLTDFVVSVLQPGAEAMK